MVSNNQVRKCNNHQNILEGFFEKGKLKASNYKVVHTSDVLRLLLIYLYGGLYLDLDYVVINDLTHYHNMLVEVG